MILEPIYEDNHIIVITKPVGVLSQSDRKHQYSLYDYLKDYIQIKYQKKGKVYLAIVHRLDRNTGGVMIFAKTSKSARRLSEQFRFHLVQKKYIAITDSIPTSGKAGNMRHYIKKNQKFRIAIEGNPMDSDSKLAELEYFLKKTFQFQNQNFYQFIVIPRTGRFHQIRFQFSMKKAPLIGDRKYGNNTIVKFPALWAYEIQFSHPVLKKDMIFRSEPPEKWPFQIEDFQLIPPSSNHLKLTD